MSVRNFDSEFCGSLPLHQINQIQAYGYLLVMSEKDFNIIQVSANVNEIFGKPATEVIGKRISEFIKPEEVEELQRKFSVDITDKIPLSFTMKVEGVEEEFIAVVHSRKNYLIAGLERAGKKNSFIDIYQELKFFIAKINLGNSIAEVSQVVVESLKQLSGWDRILMYRFDEDWNGSVIAEAREDDMESYLGLKFPASDIPRQARALYLKNPYRLIPNRDAPAIGLHPVINPVTQSFIDLSDTNLRSVAAVHLEYMSNMGIKASMSVRVIRNGKLWGLISCHHREPKYISYELCSVFELLSDVISFRISNILNQEEFNFRASLLNEHAIVLEQIYASNDLVSALFKQDSNLMKMFKASGAALQYKGKLTLIGNSPEEGAVKNLIYWLQSKKMDKVFYEKNLAADYDQAFGYVEQVAGLLVIPVGSSGEDFILLFRPEYQTTVNWGGNPEEAINFDPEGKKYHPRNSFRTWRETVKQTSKPWLAEEVEIAESLRSFIFEYSTKHLNN